jgi:putative oxidoreductase
MLGKDVMKKTLTRLQDPAYAMLRVVAGFMLSFHGMQKLFGLFGGHAIQFGAKPQLFIGGVIELLCGVAIAVGLLTRWAALLASGTMAVAYLQFHFAGDFSSSHWLPIVNGRVGGRLLLHVPALRSARSRSRVARPQLQTPRDSRP